LLISHVAGTDAGISQGVIAAGLEIVRSGGFAGDVYASLSEFAIGFALAGAASAAPYPRGAVSATDIGPASAFAENAQVSVTVALSLRNQEQLDKLVEQVYTKGSPQYRQFITPEQFKAQFGPSAETIG